DRRGEGQGGRRARDVCVPLPRGADGLRAVRRAQDGLPARLPVGLRLPYGAGAGPRRARATRARRPAAGGRGLAPEGAPRRAGGLLPAAGAGAASSLTATSRRLALGHVRAGPAVTGWSLGLALGHVRTGT